MMVGYFTEGSWDWSCEIPSCQGNNKTALEIELERLPELTFELCSAHHAQLRRLLMQALLEAEI